MQRRAATPARVIDRELPAHRRAAAPRLGAAGPRRLGGGARARASPRVLEQAGVAAEQVVGLGIDFTSCTVLPVDERRRRRCAATSAGASDRHAWPKLWKHHAAQPVADRLTEVAARARRGVSEPLRRAHLLGVVLPQADRDLVRGPRGLRRRRRLHRGDRLDHLAPDRPRVPPERARPATRRCGPRGERAAAGRVLRGGLPGVRRPAAKLGHDVRRARHARGLAARRGGRAARPAGARWRWPSATSTRSSRCPGAGVREPGVVRDRRRHLDLRHGPGARTRSACRASPAWCATASCLACTAMRPARSRSATCSPGIVRDAGRGARATRSSSARRPSSAPGATGLLAL